MNHTAISARNHRHYERRCSHDLRTGYTTVRAEDLRHRIMYRIVVHLMKAPDIILRQCRTAHVENTPAKEVSRSTDFKITGNHVAVSRDETMSARFGAGECL